MWQNMKHIQELIDSYEVWRKVPTQNFVSIFTKLTKPNYTAKP